MLLEVRATSCPGWLDAPRPREHKEAVANYARGFATSDPCHASTVPVVPVFMIRILLRTSLLRLFCLTFGCCVLLVMENTLSSCVLRQQILIDTMPGCII